MRDRVIQRARARIRRSGRRRLVHRTETPPVAPPTARWKRWVLWSYLFALLASHAWQELREPVHAYSTSPFLTAMVTPRVGSAVAGQEVSVAYREWPPSNVGCRMSDVGAKPSGESGSDIRHPTSDIPVILIHGSPGSGYEFRKLAPLIAAAGYRVIAVDLPGFGASTHRISDHSMLAHARRVLALMDSLNIERAHLVGWSNGGGVVLNMADMQPQRLASLTMLAAVGDQAMEGSGSYAVEHAKYALGLAAFSAIPAAIPHFGSLGTLQDRTDFLWNFWDSDQRPLKGIMQRLTIPTLIIHGRQDCLINAHAAEEHHQLIKTSSLVMLHANHFLPLAQAPETASFLIPFFRRHDIPGVAALTTVTDLDPPTESDGVASWFDRAREAVRKLPWWAQSSVIAKITLVAPTVGIVFCAALVVTHDADFLVAIMGIATGLIYQTLLLLILGRMLGTKLYRVPWLGRRLQSVSIIDWRRRMQTRPGAEGWITMFIARSRTASLLGAVLSRPSNWALARFVLARIPAIAIWSILSFALAFAGMLALHLAWPHVGLIRLGLAAILLGLVVRAAPMLLVTRGRHALAGWWERIVHHEYWPAWLLYLPLLPYVAWLAIKHRGLTVPTCCNPGIENGGGIVGESKSRIMEGLGGELCTPTVLIEQGPPAQRAEAVRNAMSHTPGLATFPIVLKPDEGQRGFAVRIIRNAAELQPYFESMTNPAVLQAFEEGPEECGVLWVRSLAVHNGSAPTSDIQNPTSGFIYSITRKQFPTITGDGVRTLEELIYAHPRHRRQVDVFLDRFPDAASRIPGAGELVNLGFAGNHCQGSMFTDGADLITPGLCAAIDRIAGAFRGGLDFGRFDIKFRNEATLAAGDFRVIELNGTGSESTNMYDPSRSIFWAYRVLFGQWRLMFELGSRRRAEGIAPMRLMEVWRTARQHFRERRGSPLSD